MRYALGVDLGTTYTAAGLFTCGCAEAVPLGSDALAISSGAFVGEDVVFGDRAFLLAEHQPERMAREFKRHLGEESPLYVGGRMISADELTGALATWVVQRVSELQGDGPEHLVVTYPASWGKYRHDRLAAAIVDVAPDRSSLLTEPEAAAVFYATRDRLPVGAAVAVYDLGGGTFDATVLRKTPDALELVGRPMGDDDLGGSDLDRLLLDYITGQVGLQVAELDRDNPSVAEGIRQLRLSITKAKELLSSELDTPVAISLPQLLTEVRVTRRELEHLAAPLISRTVDTLEKAVHGAGLAASDLHSILLVGGGSRMPIVGQMLAERFAVNLAIDAHPKFAICLGAAIVAGSHLNGSIVERVFDDEELPPVQPANVRLAPNATPAGAPPSALLAESVADDDLPPLMPAHHSPALRAPSAREVQDAGITATDVPVEQPAGVFESLETLEPLEARPPTNEPSITWLSERVVAPVDLASAGLLGLADVPVTSISRSRIIDDAPALRRADLLVVDDRPGTGDKRLVFVVVGVALALGLLVLVLVLVSRASATPLTGLASNTLMTPLMAEIGGGGRPAL